MRQKANALINTRDRGSKFAPDRKEKPTCLGSYTKRNLELEIEPNEKFDIETKLNKWTRGKAEGMEPSKLASGQQAY